MKVCVFTAIRSEYSILKPIMKKIQASKKLELQLIVSGMHILQQFGYSKKIIENDGFRIDYEISIPEFGVTQNFPAQVSGRILIEMSDILKKLDTELLLVLGDRFEVLASVFAAFLTNIPIAHIAGGDLSGNIDDAMRHAITKLSHIHFCTHKKSAERVKKFGEQSWRIFVVGSPAIENIKAVKVSKEKILKKYEIPLDKPYLLVLQHPETGYIEENFQKDNILTTIQALNELEMETIFIYPNYDPGSSVIIQEIEKLKKKPWIHVYQNLPPEDFIALMKYCFVMIGNSSSGIVETSGLKIPSINLGKRQLNREQVGNIINIDFDKDKIVKSVIRLQDKQFYQKLKNCKDMYGTGDTSNQIVQILENLKINSRLFNKWLRF